MNNTPKGKWEVRRGSNGSRVVIETAPPTPHAPSEDVGRQLLHQTSDLGSRINAENRIKKALRAITRQPAGEKKTT